MNNLKKYSTVLIVILIALVVTGIGVLAGWFLVINNNGKTLSWESAMRGFGVGAPSAGQNGSNYDNLGGGGGFSAGGVGGGTSGEGGDATGGSQFGSTGNTLDVSGESTSSASSSVSLAYGSSTAAVVFKTPRLWHANKTPTAGFSFATSSPKVFLSERATGYIFTADIISGDVLRRTNTLFPRTYEAYITHDGGVLYRSVSAATDSLQTFSGLMGSSTSANLGSLIGVNLPNNIIAIDANPDTRNIFYVTSSDDGSFVGMTAPWIPGKSGKAKQVFASSIGSWKPLALSDGRFFVLEKPQDGAAGYAYEIFSDGTLRPIIRGVAGLTFLPLANTNAYIYGASTDSGLSLYAQTSTTTYALPVKTVADKCVWAPYRAATKKNPASDLVVYCAVPTSGGAKSFLENWYMGAAHTSDGWWRMNLTTGESDQILSAETSGAFLDVIDPAIDPTGNFLGFKNNVDDSLWVLRIKK